MNNLKVESYVDIIFGVFSDNFNPRTQDSQISLKDHSKEVREEPGYIELRRSELPFPIGRYTSLGLLKSFRLRAPQLSGAIICLFYLYCIIKKKQTFLFCIGVQPIKNVVIV